MLKCKICDIDYNIKNTSSDSYLFLRDYKTYVCGSCIAKFKEELKFSSKKYGRKLPDPIQKISSQKYPKPKGRPIIIKRQEVECVTCHTILTTTNAYPERVKNRGSRVCKYCTHKQDVLRDTDPEFYNLKKAVRSLLKKIAAEEQYNSIEEKEKRRERYKIFYLENKEKCKFWMRRYRQTSSYKKGNRARTSKRERNLDWNPLNEYMEGFEGHHLNKEDVLYIPRELHHSIKHNVFTGKNMDKINFIAIQWYLLYYWMLDTTAREYITLDKIKGEINGKKPQIP